MNVSLTPELEKLVNEKVASGLYNSASEVVRHALRVMQEHEALQQYKLAELKREINIGLEQARRGEGKSLNLAEIKAEVRRRLAKRKKAA